MSTVRRKNFTKYRFSSQQECHGALLKGLAFLDTPEGRRRRTPFPGSKKGGEGEQLLYYSTDSDGLVVQLLGLGMEAALLERQGRDGLVSSKILEIVTGTGVSQQIFHY